MASSESPTTTQHETPSAAEAAMAGFWSRLSQGEQIAFAGAAVLLVIGEWLLADLIGWNGQPIEVEIAAAEVLLLIAVRALRPSIAWPVPYAVLLASAAVVVVVPTVDSFLGVIHEAGVLSDGASLVGSLVDWIAAAAVGVGAYLNWARSRA